MFKVGKKRRMEVGGMEMYREERGGEEYNRNAAWRRTGHIYLFSVLLSLTQHNLKSLQLCPLMLSQPAVGQAPETLLSQPKHSTTISFTAHILTRTPHETFSVKITYCTTMLSFIWKNIQI